MNNEKREWDFYFGMSGIVIVIVSFILSIIDNTYAFIGLCGFAIGCILVVIGIIIKKVGDIKETDIVEQNRNIAEQNKKDVSEWFDTTNRIYGVKIDHVLSIRKKVYSIYILQKYHYWIKDKKLFFSLKRKTLFI